jgi:pyrroloquinoline quinone (PQQ) biosynthesis protein C
MYFFEASTPQICQSILEALERQPDVPEKSLDYVRVHAKVDVKHSQMLRDAIAVVVEAVPDAGGDILYGQEVFAAVYPLPIFEAAFARA